MNKRVTSAIRQMNGLAHTHLYTEEVHLRHTSGELTTKHDHVQLGGAVLVHAFKV